MSARYKWIILLVVAIIVAAVSIGTQLKDRYVFVALVLQPVLAPLYVALAYVGVKIRDRLFAKRKYKLYILALVSVIMLSTLLGEYLNPHIGTDYQPISSQLHFIGATFIILATHFIQSLSDAITRKVEDQEYEYERVRAALQLLKRQLKPHFLFNTLQSIYVSATQQNKDTAVMIMNLSDMLRYQLLMETTDRVTLQQEIDFLQHYVYFEQRRMPPNMKVVLTCDVSNPDLKIAPNMLTPLVENAFKHGVVAPQEAVISISISQNGRQINLQTSNVIGDSAERDGGIGVPNLRKRLEYLYPNKHDLSFDEHAGTFHAKLRITL